MMSLDDLLEKISILNYLFYLSVSLCHHSFILGSPFLTHFFLWVSLSKLLQIDIHPNYVKTLYEI